VKEMGGNTSKTAGIKLLIKGYKKQFRIPENLNHYSKKDYQEAEKRFVKFCIHHAGGHVSERG
jgi:hypothetical protein